jgi:endonuclease/exonuclease/phosphatase (EEP) superfamily protein YafD
LERFQNQHPTATDEGTGNFPLLDPVATRQPLCPVLNCYLQPGEQQNLKDRAVRVTEIVRDIIKQDPSTPIVVCGDFNNHMAYIVEQLGYLSFTAAVDPSTETHRQGGHLDQVFVRNMTIGEVVLSPGYSDEVSDHKCIKAP